MTIEQAATIPEVPFETTTTPPVTEDGIALNPSAISFVPYEERVIDLGSGILPANLYGSEDSYEVVVDTPTPVQPETSSQHGLEVEAFTQEVLDNNPDLTVDTLTASLSNPASDAFPVVGYGTPSLPENDIMVASAALEGNRQLIRFRVFENDVRLSDIYNDWGIDTFHTFDEAATFVRRWGHPGLTDDELNAIEVLPEVPLDCKLGDAPRTMLIKVVDLSHEPIPQRFKGLQGIEQANFDAQAFDNVQHGDDSVIVSVTPDGRCVAVVRKDNNSQSMKEVWRAQPLAKPPQSWINMVERATLSKKTIVPIQMKREDVLTLNALLPHVTSVDQYIKWVSVLRRAQQSLSILDTKGEDTQTLEELITYLSKLNRQR